MGTSTYSNIHISTSIYSTFHMGTSTYSNFCMGNLTKRSTHLKFHTSNLSKVSTRPNFCMSDLKIFSCLKFPMSNLTKLFIHSNCCACNLIKISTCSKFYMNDLAIWLQPAKYNQPNLLTDYVPLSHGCYNPHLTLLMLPFFVLRKQILCSISTKSITLLLNTFPNCFGGFTNQFLIQLSILQINILKF